MVSFIVPVYNAERYLGRCVESLLTQSYTDFEIILVDDGSTDASLALCNEYKAKDEARIKVIHKQNGGVSSARNEGLKACLGEYVAFIDADDYVEQDYLEVLLKKAQEYRADIVCCDFIEILSEHASPNAPRVKADRILEDGFAFFSDVLAEDEGYPFCVWGKIIKSSLAKQVYFKDMKIGEDHLYMFDLFRLSPKVYLTAYKGYYYAVNEGSATVRMDAAGLARTADVLNMQKYKAQNLPDFAQKLKDGFYCKYASACLGFIGALCRSENGVEHISLAKEEIKNIFDGGAKLGKGACLKLCLFYLFPKAYMFGLNCLKRKIR